MFVDHSWSVLNDDDDEPTQTVSVSGVGSDAAATGEKKKRKKNKKKGDKSEKSGEEAAGSDVKLSTTGVLEDVVAKAAALGFKRAAVEAAIDAMWNEQLPYDDPNAVIARLQGKPWPPAAQPQVRRVAPPCQPNTRGCVISPDFRGDSGGTRHTFGGVLCSDPNSGCSTRTSAVETCTGAVRESQPTCLRDRQTRTECQGCRTRPGPSCRTCASSR